jgi:hypothetical protein
MRRAVPSIEPPAAAGTTISTVLSGRHAACCACDNGAAVASAAMKASADLPFLWKIISILLPPQCSGFRYRGGMAS